MIDSHCHIAGQEFAGDLEAVVTRARAAGLQGALTILAADDDVELRQAAAVQRLWPDVRFSIGTHFCPSCNWHRLRPECLAE